MINNGKLYHEELIRTIDPYMAIRGEIIIIEAQASWYGQNNQF